MTSHSKSLRGKRAARFWAAALFLAALALAGCDGDTGKASKTDEANLKRLSTEGLQPQGGAPKDGGTAGAGEVTP